MLEYAALYVAGTVFALVLWLSLAAIRHESKSLAVDEEAFGDASLLGRASDE